MRADSSRESGPDGVCSNCQYAPSTWTWAIDSGAEPPARTQTEMPSGPSAVRSTTSVSIGGTLLVR